MNFIVQNIADEPYFYRYCESFKELESLKNKARRQNNTKVEVRIYTDTMDKKIHSEVINLF
jgi:hypothetical protein